jgi:energy-coupling factor transporter ATP-binding protein EcfA2
LAILNEIQKWAQTQPAWQQHAIAVLYEQAELSEEDFEHVYALLKVEKGIPDPQHRTHRMLTPEQIAAPQAGRAEIQLTAIRDLRGVNALAPGKTLPLSSSGLTVIYGDNGAGKSGYSRVLKQACRARDRSEKIRGNVYVHPVLHEQPTAKFDALIDGATAELTWTDGHPSPIELSSIAIFDSRCARAYVDNHGDFAYVPYGLDILEGLAKVCTKLKDRALRDQAASRPNVDAFTKLTQTATEAGRLVASLSAKTRKEEIERLATLSEDDVALIASLTQTLGEADPKKKAAEIRARALRIEGLATRASAAEAIVADERLKTLQDLIDKSNKAKVAAQVAAKRFEDLGALEGTGGESWGELFKSARMFCAESPSVAGFPHLHAEAKCPLCQNELGPDGSVRLAAFDEFIQGAAASAAKAARKTAGDAYKAIMDAPLEYNLDDSLRNDLGASIELANTCEASQAVVRARREVVRMAASLEKGDAWECIPVLTASPVMSLRTLVEELRHSAKSFEDSVNITARAAMEKQLAELDARRQLTDLKASALAAINRFELAAKLGDCASAASTVAISRKSTDLTNTMATQEVAAALMKELQALGVNEIKIAMKPSSAKAKTTFKLVLETENGTAVADVLSEGEQRAIAIASFLAEVRLGTGCGGVVFDDPVSSLDHTRREHVARRLATEAEERQVIVFTHDLYFLSVLMDEAKTRGSTPLAFSLSRTPEGYGVAEESLPFAGSNIKARVGMLRTKQVDCARMHKNGDVAGYRLHVRDFYNDLRMGWERGVEELLFNNVVIRFRKGIETNRLSKVQVNPEDLAAINKGMTTCSNYTGHDSAMVANLPTPSPDDMTKHLDELDAWRKLVDDRLNGRLRTHPQS